MKILVTGGAGFIASHIVDKYIELGHEVFIFDNLSTGKKNNLNPRAEFLEVDIRNRGKIETMFSKIKPEILSHHAAQLDVRKSVADPIYDAEVNIVGFLNLLESGIKNNLKKVIFASSGGVVYGDADVIPTNEEYNPLRPLSPYGVAKLTTENYLFFYYKAYNVPYIALRYANIYGPRQDPHGEAGVVAIFTQKLLKNEQPLINGDGLQTRDYVFIADVVDANVKSIDSEYVGPLNIGTGKETDVNTIFNHLVKSTNTNFTESHGPAKRGEQKRSCLDNRLAKKVLDWEPKISIVDGLKDTVDFFKNINE